MLHFFYQLQITTITHCQGINKQTWEEGKALRATMELDRKTAWQVPTSGRSVASAHALKYTEQKRIVGELQACFYIHL